MKTYKNLWEKFISKENFELAYKNSIKNKSKQRQIKIFKEDVETNLENVRHLVINGNFHTARYKKKKIYEPKERIIYKLPYNPDRIVQHAVVNILKPILTNKFIQNSFACIEGRGQLKASQRCAEYVRRNKYCLKCDIHHFYPSINQHILSSMLHKIIKDERFMVVVDDIIFSFPGGYNCPIGNFCSMWFGNFYITPLDNYVLHELKCSDYLRYNDDFLLFSNDKDFLIYCKENIKIFIKDKLELEYSKCDLFDTKQGVDFCGYRHFKKYVLIRKRTAKRMKRRLKDLHGTYDHMLGQIASANGIMKHSNSHNLRIKTNIDNLKNIIMNRRHHNGISK